MGYCTGCISGCQALFSCFFFFFRRNGGAPQERPAARHAAGPRAALPNARRKSLFYQFRFMISSQMRWLLFRSM